MMGFVVEERLSKKHLFRSTQTQPAYHFKKVIKYPKPTNIMTSTAKEEGAEREIIRCLAVARDWCGELVSDLQ